MKEHHLDLGYSRYGWDDTEEVRGLSPEETTIGIDLTTIGGEGLFPEVKGTAENLPIRSDSLSSVWAGHVMGVTRDEEQPYADIDKTLNEISRTLKVGGKLFVRMSEEDYLHVKRNLKSLGFIITDENHESDENFIWATKKGR